MEIELNIVGMTCQHCQQAVQQALQQVAGVNQVRVDLEQKKAWVEGEPDREAMRLALDEEGFSLAPE